MNDVQLIQTPCVFGENGNYLLERELGKGGMGGVYMGRDKMLDRKVAIKVMLKELGSDPTFVERFQREAQAALQALGYTSAEAARALNQVRDQADTADKLILLAVRQLSGM